MRFSAMFTLLVLLLAGFALAAGNGPVPIQDRFHDDHRSTPKLLFNPAYAAKAGVPAEDAAWSYLAAKADQFALPGNLSNVQLREVKDSLLGRHVYFQQYINGIPVDKAEIIVSVARDGRILKVFNNTYPQSQAKALPAGLLKEEGALEIAWQHLRVHGELMCAPKAELVYVPEGADFRLVYKTLTGVEAPFGYWEHVVDAATGQILSVRDTAIRFRPLAAEEPDFSKYNGPVLDRGAALVAYAARESRQAEMYKADAVRASGTGKVFDPDPMSTLNNDTLLDTSPASSFTAAYFTRNLLDITLNAGTYSLVGSWVQIINFESPATAPSTTTTGNWTAERGNNAFNDVMTYYHIDTNQRYIQSLGYTNIQYLSIGVDSDGLSGDDNSHYIPSTNRIAYGHGGVDDNEDVDVILHEYWHAIQHSINASWGGNDTGAMGEGFGDYWPASYGYEFPNGPTFHVDWAFHWDGHNSFWDGRQLDRTTAVYNPALTYPAHSVVGGVNGDELWGTPIWQAFKDLRALGVPRTEIDTIILESNFGLGANLKMPDMANAIVATALELYPAGAHAGKFYDRFVQVNILQTPCQFNSVTVGDCGYNGVADPTETISLTVVLHNQGAATLTSVHGDLTTTTPGVTILQNGSDYNNIAAGANGSNLDFYTVEIPYGFPCGTAIDFNLEVTYYDTATRTNNFAFSVDTGDDQMNELSATPNLAIPDNNTTGVSSTLTFTGTGAIVNSSINFDVNITHPYKGDLIVQVTSPAGTTVVLHNRTGSSADNIVGNYPGTITPANSLSAFYGQPLDGAWVMNVSDRAGSDVGTFNSWGIHAATGCFCEIAGDVDGNAVVTMDDAIIGLQEMNGNDTGVTINPWADMDGDAVIGAPEIQFILGYLAGTWVF